jgi:hypothetical protein
MKDNIVIFEDKNGSIELRADIEKDTLWATRIQIAQVFETTPQNITIHLGNIYAEGELTEKATSKKSLLVQKEGGRATKRPIDVYNLDAIIAVGYRINSKKATQFRIWATSILHRYLVDGHALNKPRLESAPEKLVGLYKTIAFLESKSLSGKLKGRITLKLTEDMEPIGK